MQNYYKVHRHWIIWAIEPTIMQSSMRKVIAKKSVNHNKLIIAFSWEKNLSKYFVEEGIENLTATTI